jgi:hypothetical protein
MLSLIKKYKHIFIIILILVIAVVLIFKYGKLTLNQGSLSFKVVNAPKPEKLAAAALLFAPTTGQFYIGDTVNIALVVNTLNQSINVVEGKITFPSDKLEAISISKTNSIISLWAQEPVVSKNQNGFIAFSGGLPSPGFIGTAGQIISVSFKVKSEGEAVIGIEDAQVLANDGFGTNILGTTTPTHLALLKPEIKREIADVNEDGRVDLIDISILLTNWGTPKNQGADLNGDGKVDARDLSTLLSKWSH